MLYRYCPQCAAPLELREAGERRRAACPACDFVHYRNPTTGVAVVVLRGAEILLVRRRGSYDGSWCIPCGHVEWDEDLRDCARREMLEETGLEVELGPVIDVLSNFHDRSHQTVGVWLAGAVRSGQLHAGSDAREVRYVPLDALPRDMAFPTDLEICSKLRAQLGREARQDLPGDEPAGWRRWFFRRGTAR